MNFLRGTAPTWSRSSTCATRTRGTSTKASHMEYSASHEQIEVTVLLPCLNEEATVGACVESAAAYLKRSNIHGEILVVDNGSSDNTASVARQAGAHVVYAPTKGYGAALRTGIESASGRYIIMGDADCSYDFSNLDAFVAELRRGRDLVVGNRFRGGISRNAMPFLHRYLGNPVLSWIGRRLFDVPIYDFHCGLRAFRTDRIRALALQTVGMEFASELIVRSALEGYTISEVPTTLNPDQRGRAPHLRTWRDGWRHLRFLFLYCPRWVFLVPGLWLSVGGLALLLRLYAGPIVLGFATLDVNTMIYAACALVLGAQLATMGIVAKKYVVMAGLHRPSRVLDWAWKYYRLEYGLLAGAAMVLLGLGIAYLASSSWAAQGYGPITDPRTTRDVVLSATLLVLGAHVIFSCVLLSILGIEVRPDHGRTKGQSDASGRTSAEHA